MTRPFALVTMLAIAVLLGTWLAARDEIETTTYSEFEQRLAAGDIDRVTIVGDTISGHLKSPAPDGARTIAATLVEPPLADELRKFNVPFQRVPQSTWLGGLLSTLLPLFLIIAAWTYLSRKMSGAGNLLGLGASKARLYMQKDIAVRFTDVAGVDEAKAELQEVVDFLRNPRHYGRLGARIPKGVLLIGPTGTGKTLLARAVAGEAGVAFFSISGSAFIEMFVGVGAARVRDLFEQARANAPAIIFIDELDALGKVRALFPLAGGHEEREQTLNQLLVELDGFDPAVGVVLLAATNRPEILDPALLRAGRFDRQILVDRPDRAGRLAILRVHAKKIRLAPGTDLDQVAAITVGFAGADLANLVNEAAIVATRRDADAVTLQHFNLAIERIVAGIEKKHALVNVRERELAATHELGHALTALALPGADRVHKVSIIPHGIGALGYTLQRPAEDRHLLTRTQVTEKIMVLLGGYAAEVLVFGEPSTGAADDLAKATDLARDMVLRFGMDDAIGPVSYEGSPVLTGAPAEPAGALPPRRTWSPHTAQQIDDAVRSRIEAALERTTALLQARRSTLDRCVSVLLERESLDEEDLLSLVQEPTSMKAAG
uniref:ATP-dependent zinc metalloprotease FtsH n=1 Tax=Bordetella sputigena TaxID=1416810 RepID=UPI0039EDF41D